MSAEINGLMPSGSAALRSAPASTRTLRALDAAFAGGEEQRRHAAERQPLLPRLRRRLTLPLFEVRVRVDVGAVREELANHRADAAARRPTSARSVRASSRAHRRRRRAPAGPWRPRRCRSAPRSSARFRLRVPSALASTPALSSRSMRAALPLTAGEIERGHAVAVRRVHVGARANQLVGRVRIVRANRPVQRRRAVGFRRVDVGTLAEQQRRPRPCRPPSRPRRRDGRRRGPAEAGSQRPLDLRRREHRPDRCVTTTASDIASEAHVFFDDLRALRGSRCLPSSLLARP